MLRHIAAFEWRYQLKSPVFWVGCLIFFLLAFGATTVDQVQIGSLGNVHKNAPFAILQTIGIMGVFATFTTVAMVANVVVRDDETNFAPIIRSTSVGKASYLVGRFAGASAAALLVLASVPLAILLGSWMPWQDIEKIGPLRLGDYAFALFAFALPTLLITSAFYFAVATATRSMMWTYVAAVGVLVLYVVAHGAVRNDPTWDRTMAILDPFGMSALSSATKYWTANERNARLPDFTGLLLFNRLLWSGIALAVFAAAYRAFRFEVRFQRERPGADAADGGPAGAARPRRSGRVARALQAHRAELAAISETNPAGVRELLAAGARRASVVLPDIPPASRATARAQLWELAKVDMAFVFRSPAFFVLLAIGLINSAAGLWFIGEIYGSPSYPVTRLMVEALNGSFSLMPIIIAVFYGGELVWRDRDRRMHEIVDATAAPDWAHLVPKIVAITGVLLASSLVAVLAGVAVQALRGYFRFQIDAYFLWFVWPTTVYAVLIAILSVFVQVLVPQKYIGWGVMLLYIVATIALAGAGFEHHLYDYAGTPPVPLSDMNGQGRFWVGQAWFHLYWLAFATLLLVATYALWRRGATSSLRPRLAHVRERLRGRPAIVAAIAALVWLGSGAWIFYNTNVLNAYLTRPDLERRLADREKTLLRYEKVPQPRIADVTLDVQLYPKQARAVTHGRYVLVNRGTQPVDTLHLAWDERLELDAVDFAGATVQTDFPRFHYRIYKLATPIQPGEQRTLGFSTTLEERGFPNSRPLTTLVANGSFVDNDMIAPEIGFTRRGLLEDRAKRRKYGLPPELRPAKLEDDSARANNALRRDSDWVNADITVTTDADQTPMAPGRTLSDATQGGRRTVHFRSDAPINDFFSIQSARYEVRKAVWHASGHDVDLAVYYEPGHEFNVDRMLAAMRTSLALFNEKFSPYQFNQARILEFPAYRVFAQSFANTIPFSEGIGFIQHPTDASKIDVATYVTAHEIGHQWWGHQIVSSDQQGAAMLIETFAQYSALLVMERVYGHDEVRRFLKYELDRYLRSRGGAVLEELPLDRVEDQDYIYYRKGSLVMYWAKEALGEEVVDRALRKLLAQYAFKGAPYPTTRDFLTLLRAEAGPQNDALITDLFDRITLLDLKASNASAHKRADGKYDLSFDVEAHKFYADGAGKETEATMDELVELGVFSDRPGDKTFGAKDVLVLDKRRIETGALHVSLTVDRAPAWVGIDPYNKRIDRNSDDNLVKVELR